MSTPLTLGTGGDYETLEALYAFLVGLGAWADDYEVDLISSITVTAWPATRVAQNGRTIFYAAAASANSMRKPMLDNFINTVFGGNSRLLMNHLIENEALSQEDLNYLQAVVNKTKDAK